MLYSELSQRKTSVGVVGLGYVGLPLAALLADRFNVIGFDINQSRINELKDGFDRTGEVQSKGKLLNENLMFTSDREALKECKLLIVTVPTPVDQFRNPDLTPLERASETVSKVITKGSTVVFESTVYPGVTEDICAKIIEKESGLKVNQDFFVGYSPERVNPGDKEHTIDKITKVVSGSTPEIAAELEKIYGAVIKAGIHLAPNIKTAEAAKVIENTQRDLNIALINELAVMFDDIGIDTTEVLEAAGTKWNFLKFKPGLVGGHCIGVDPYYLTHLADKLGFHTELIKAGRRTNDSIPRFIAQKTVQMIMSNKKSGAAPHKVLICGVTFKENVPDLRNSKVFSLIKELERFGVKLYLYDPVVDSNELKDEEGLEVSAWQDIPQTDAVILAVPHDEIVQKKSLSDLMAKASNAKILIDIKSHYSLQEAADSGVLSWRL